MVLSTKGRVNIRVLYYCIILTDAQHKSVIGMRCDRSLNSVVQGAAKNIQLLSVKKNWY